MVSVVLTLPGDSSECVVSAVEEVGYYAVPPVTNESTARMWSPGDLLSPLPVPHLPVT